MSARPLRSSLAALAVALPMATEAQVAPDAGSLLQQQQQQGPRRQAPPPVPSFPEAPRSAPTTAQQALVTVKAFRIEGAPKAISSARIADALKPFEGRSLTLQQLQDAVEAVTQLYRDNGWFLARAVLPPQDVTEGLIRIQVIEGTADRREAIRWQAGSALRLPVPVAQQYLASAMQPGEPLRRQSLERSLLLLNELPGLRARASLEAGAEPGSSRLVMDLDEGPLFAGAVRLDNQGSRYTGAERLHATANLNNPLGRGDQAELRASKGLGDGTLENLRLGYQLPLGADGWRVGLHVNHLRYALGEELASLQAQGSARGTVLSARYPLIATRGLGISLNAAAESNTMRNDANGANVNDKRLRSTQLGVQVTSQDEGGQTQASLSASQGRLDLGANPTHQAQDRAPGGPNTEGSFSKLSAQGIRWHALPGGLTLQAQAQVQWADGNLDSSEKMSLGGAQGVRAYPAGEAAGDRAWRASVELSRPLEVAALIAGASAQWSVFVDAGEVQQHARPAGIAMQTPNRYRLSGVGAGLSGRYGAVEMRLQWARALGNNPGRSAQGKDSDGLARSSRV